MGLTDMVAAISVGGYHIANVHCGQVYTPVAKDLLRQQHGQLGLAKLHISFDSFCRARESLPRLSRAQVNASKHLLTELASLISEKATALATIDMLGSLGRNIAPVMDLKSGLLEFLEHAKRLVRADSASVWLRDPDSSDKLYPIALTWGSDTSKDSQNPLYRERIQIGSGLVGRVFASSREVICETQAEVDETRPTIESSRVLRGLKSFLGVPMSVGQTQIGVFEVGSRAERALRRRDAPLVATLASFAGGFAKSALLTKMILAFSSARGFSELVSAVVRQIPPLVNASGASLFLRRKAGEGAAFLVDTSYLNRVLVAEDFFLPEPHLRDRAFYEPLEGLTGWVLGTRQMMNLAIVGGEDRDSALVRMNGEFSVQGLPPATWKGKYSLGDSSRGREYYLKKPMVAVPLLTERMEALGVLSVPERNEGNFTSEDCVVLRFCADQIVRALSEKVVPIELVSALAATIDAKDPYTEHHSRNVRSLCLSIGGKLGWDEKALQRLELAALMHDIGKIGIPDSILGKPGRLNKAEKRAIEVHPIIGNDILKGVTLPGMEMIRRAVYEHHERMDGTGYPRGLKGDEISIAARIIAVADSFDAMTASRPYKERMDGKTAVEDIAKHTPSWYDSSVVQAFVEAFHAVLENAS